MALREQPRLPEHVDYALPDVQVPPGRQDSQSLQGVYGEQRPQSAPSAPVMQPHQPPHPRKAPREGGVYQYGEHGHTYIGKANVNGRSMPNMDYLHVRVSKMVASSRLSARDSGNPYSLLANCSIARGTDYVSQQRRINTYSLGAYKSLPGLPRQPVPRSASERPGRA